MFFSIKPNNIHSISNNSDIKVKGLTLKVCLIQTAYELYEVNVKNKENDNNSLYKNISSDAYKHYKWLVNTYSDFDNITKSRLENIFESNFHWDYLNATMNLDDDASLKNIIDSISNDTYLNLSSNQIKDLEIFFNDFYKTYFYSYFNKNKLEYEKKSKEINTLLNKKDVNITRFIEHHSNVNFDTNYKYVFYYSLNHIQSQDFKYDNTLISTIPKNTDYSDYITIPLHEYSHIVFDAISNNPDFLAVYEKLKNNNKLNDMYNKEAKNYFSYKDWILENLIEGFSKFLNYRYYQGTREENIYMYDLEFYNYLRNINFNPQTSSLKDVTIYFCENLAKNN